jgi:hypothetical protein
MLTNLSGTKVFARVPVPRTKMATISTRFNMSSKCPPINLSLNLSWNPSNKSAHPFICLRSKISTLVQWLFLDFSLNEKVATSPTLLNTVCPVREMPTHYFTQFCEVASVLCGFSFRKEKWCSCTSNSYPSICIIKGKNQDLINHYADRLQQAKWCCTPCGSGSATRIFIRICLRNNCESQWESSLTVLLRHLLRLLWTTYKREERAILFFF